MLLFQLQKVQYQLTSLMFNQLVSSDCITNGNYQVQMDGRYATLFQKQGSGWINTHIFYDSLNPTINEGTTKIAQVIIGASPDGVWGSRSQRDYDKYMSNDVGSAFYIGSEIIKASEIRRKLVQMYTMRNGYNELAYERVSGLCDWIEKNAELLTKECKSSSNASPIPAASCGALRLGEINQFQLVPFSPLLLDVVSDYACI